MKIRGTSGHTLLEIVIASVLIGMIFVMITTLYATSLKFLRGDMASNDLDTLLALETMARNASTSTDAVVDMGGSQLKLRIDTNNPSTATALDDQWVSYRFLRNGAAFELRNRTVLPPAAAPANVTAADREVVSGLPVLGGAGQSGFQLLNPSTPEGAPTVVQIMLVVSGTANSQPRTFLTSVALERAK